VLFVVPLRFLLLDRHDLVLVNSFESHLLSILLPLVVFKELVKVLVLVKAAFHTVAIHLVIVLFEVIFVHGQNVSVAIIL